MITSTRQTSDSRAADSKFLDTVERLRAGLCSKPKQTLQRDTEVN